MVGSELHYVFNDGRTEPGNIQRWAITSDAWQSYEPPLPKMTLAEAVAVVIREGGGTISRRGDADSDEDGVCFCADDVQADDWEVLP